MGAQMLEVTVIEHENIKILLQMSVYMAIRYCHVDTIILGHILMIYGNITSIKRLWWIGTRR